MCSIVRFFARFLSSVRNVVLKVFTNKKKKEKNVTKLPPGISCLQITKNISLFRIEAKIASKLKQEQEKSLVVLIGWMSSKREHTRKYANIWLDRGFDVLTVNFTAVQFVWPARGTHVVAAEILAFLDQESKPYSQILIHGFSAGGYLWGEVMVQLVRDMARYQHFLNRIIGQIWDSIGDVEEVPIGVSEAIFPRNKFLANALLQYMLFHFRAFERIATRHYRTSSKLFHRNLVRAPALLILSKTDPLVPESTIRRLGNNWEKLGIRVEYKVFEKSPHVGHYKRYPQEYIAQIDTFLGGLSLGKHIQ